MAFIFIGRGGHTPSKSGYKRTLQLKSNLIRITQDQAGRPSAMTILAANIMLFIYLFKNVYDQEACYEKEAGLELAFLFLSFFLRNFCDSFW